MSTPVDFHPWCSAYTARMRSQVTPSEDEDVVEAPSTNGPDPTLREGVLFSVYSWASEPVICSTERWVFGSRDRPTADKFRPWRHGAIKRTNVARMGR